MSGLRQLAGQTVVYGLSSIVGRLLNYLLVPLYTYTFTEAAYGVVTELYAYTALLFVLFTYGMETAFFRFYTERKKDPAVFSTAQRALFISTIVFVAVLMVLAPTIAEALYMTDHPEYIRAFAAILGFDALSALPFARLRAENKPLRFALLKLVNIGLNIGLNLFFIVLLADWCAHPETGIWHQLAQSIYRPSWGILYIFLANLLASGITWILLLPQQRAVRWGFDSALFGAMLRYAWPLIIVGLAGIVNETFDRILLKFLLPGSPQENQAAIGIYGACYKLSVLMTLFIQAYRYAAEPFFFAQSSSSDAKKIYAQSLTAFFIAGNVIFLGIVLYLDIFKYFIGPDFRAGLHIVPILLIANLFLGTYYNLSIWYKLTDRTKTGAWIAGAGAILTLLLNIILIPTMGYEGAAWTTLAAYASMSVAAYFLGKKHYPVPYPVGRLTGYLLLSVLIYALSRWLAAAGITETLLMRYALHFILLLTFLAVTLFAERPWSRWGLFKGNAK